MLSWTSRLLQKDIAIYGPLNPILVCGMPILEVYNVHAIYCGLSDTKYIIDNVFPRVGIVPLENTWWDAVERVSCILYSEVIKILIKHIYIFQPF